MRAKTRPASAAFGRIFRAYSSEVLGPGASARCELVRRILFFGFSSAWIEENQKFDLSFSSAGAPCFRFSFSDYGEKGLFAGKLAGAFAALKGGYDLAALGAALAVGAPSRDRHQTTFGMEWPSGASSPRLKLYFEELRSGYDPAGRVRLLARVCSALKLPRPRGGHGEIAAIGMDFLPGGELMLKTYMYSAAPPAGFGGAALDRFAGALSREGRAFFYSTVRYGADGETASRKLYKVYEVRQINDFRPALAEIYGALLAAGAGEEVRRLERYRALAAINGSIWYPVLCAMDTGRGGAARIDTYFSLR
jgi:hypothetical protein